MTLWALVFLAGLVVAGALVWRRRRPRVDPAYIARLERELGLRLDEGEEIVFGPGMMIPVAGDPRDFIFPIQFDGHEFVDRDARKDRYLAHAGLYHHPNF